jgi:hypothetical protein
VGEEQETVKFALGIVKWAFVSPTMISSPYRVCPTRVRIRVNLADSDEVCRVDKVDRGTTAHKRRACIIALLMGSTIIMGSAPQ